MSCAEQDKNLSQKQLIVNPFFDHGLGGWHQDLDGASWQPFQSSASVEGFNISKFLHQGQFENGTYRIMISLTNNNPVIENYNANGLLKVYQQHDGVYTFLKEGSVIVSNTTVTQSFIIDLESEQNQSAIAIQVQRCGYGTSLNMTLHTVQLTKL